MTDFKTILDEYSWNDVHTQIYNATNQDVQHALEKDHLTLADFRALISPAAAPYLEQWHKKHNKSRNVASVKPYSSMPLFT